MPKVRTAVVELEKLVPGGQAIGCLDSGKKIFVWGGLPGEKVEVRVTKNKSSHAEGVVTFVITSSKDRIEPKDPDSYLSTSPWQIMSYDLENQTKKDLVAESARQNNVNLPNFKIANLVDENSAYHYRNKMEYSFYGDEVGLHLALFRRASHSKIIVDGSSLATELIDKSANEILSELNRLKVRASDLKSLIIRTTRDGKVVASLFAKTKDIPGIEDLDNIDGMSIIYSDPKSPASVITKVLSQKGQDYLIDELNKHKVKYGVNGFFQVNIPVFEMAMSTVKKHIGDQPILDMYGGVGTISTAVGATNTIVVESDELNIGYARENIGDNGQVIHAKSESILDHIDKNRVLIIDPPRAGLHKNLIEKISEAEPEQIIYLSCNPATMMRDLALLERYKIEYFDVYNFFPRTPHIEALAVLKLA